MKTIYTLLCTLMLLLSTSCSHHDDGPTGLEVGRTEINFPAAGSTQRLVIRCTERPIVRSDAPWLTVSPVASTGNNPLMWNVQLTAAPNTTGAPRSATVAVSSEDQSASVAITQSHS